MSSGTTLIILLILVFGSLCIYEKAKYDTRHIDVCAEKKTAEEQRQCRDLVNFANSAGW